MTPAELAHAASLVLDDRRRRAGIFGPAQDGFGEPAWEMLLHLVIDAAARPAMPAAELIERVGIGDEFGRIYIKWMGTRRLATHDETDDRVQLTDRGLEHMAAYLDAGRGIAGVQSAILGHS